MESTAPHKQTYFEDSFLLYFKNVSHEGYIKSIMQNY